MNLRKATLDADRRHDRRCTRLLARTRAERCTGGGLTELVVGLRPEASTLAADSQAGTPQLAVTLVEELGADAYVYGELDGDRPPTSPG